MLDDFKNAFQKPNNAHVQLIVINVVVFVVMGILLVVSEISRTDFYDMIHQQFAIPARFGTFISHPWTLITYAFAHAGFYHILFNMFALYWFGRLFVEYLGSDKLIAVYFLGALFGAILYLLAFNTIPYFTDQSSTLSISMVGASAAVDAIIVAAATLLPEYTFFLLLIGPVKIKYIAAVAVFLSFLGTVGGNAGGNIAHLGGAMIGFIYIKQLQAGVNWGGWITTLLDSFKGLFAAQPKVKVTYRKTEPKIHQPTSKASKASQDEIDNILDKISDHGYESLSKEEKEKLFNASKK
jgi:membrane associated rhomboid family serine protease